MSKLRAVLAMVAGVLAGSLVPAVAFADDPASPEATAGSFTSPAAGSTYVDGDVVTFTVAGLSDWHATIWCDNDDLTVEDAVDEAAPHFEALNNSFADLPCVADLYDADGLWHDDVSFTVAPRTSPNEVRNLTARPEFFYPYVRDGYRDRVNLGFAVRSNAEVTMTVRNDDGRTVRTVVLQRGGGGDSSYDRSWASWNGRKDNGELAPLGRYRVVITSAGPAYETARANIGVRVATGWRVTRRTKRLDPWVDSRDQTRGNCFVSESSYPYGNELDCWGGAYAQATYRVRVPDRATVTEWWAGGRRGCCDNGRVIKTGERVSPGVFRIRVRVTNWAAFTVTRVGLTFRYRYRI